MVLPLTRQGAVVGSVFTLVGAQDNGPAAAMGFALSRSPSLAAALTKRVARAAGVPLKAEAELSLALEVAADGDTDLDIRNGSSSVFIVKPYSGWRLPSAQQLAQAAERVVAAGGKGVLVSLSQASYALAAHSLPADLDGIPVIHLTWADVVTEVEQVIVSGRGLRERMWLDEIRTYLEEVMRVRPIEDSWTYCVVVNDDKPGGTATYREIVTEQRKYFHPYGVGDWPTEPPNFLAFRWDGAVRRIHRVVGYEVVPDLADRWPEMTGATTARPHAVYDLGPRLPPHEPIANGSLRVTAKLWVLLDQLQTSPTLAQAHTRSKELSKQS